MAIAHRVTPEAEPVLTQETTFHPRTSALTESFVEYRGYWLPHCYNNEGAIAEYWACREKAVVMDLSPLRKWEVLGPDAERSSSTRSPATSAAWPSARSSTRRSATRPAA